MSTNLIDLKTTQSIGKKNLIIKLKKNNEINIKNLLTQFFS
jgi:hypothetical protein